VKSDRLVDRFLPFAFCLLPFAFSLTSCAPRATFAVPTGAGTPAPDAATAWSQATEACRSARSLSAELRISGQAGRQKLHSATLHGAVTSGDQIYFEMPVPFGAPGFILAGTGDRATLLLPRDKRVLHARAEEIVEALVGLKLGPRQLLALLAGCVDQTEQIALPQRFGDLVAVSTPAGRVFLRQGVTGWRVAAASTATLVVDYQQVDSLWPVRVRITSAAGTTPPLDISLGLSQIEVNGQLAPSIFSLDVPNDTTPLTLQQLRDAGPLGEKK
jgi:hypothetical protein